MTRFSPGKEVMLMHPSSMPGVATRSPFDPADVASTAVFGRSEQVAKEQKFKAFTSKLCKSHGGFRSAPDPSMGKSFDNVVSSCSLGCHTRSLLSRPWLYRD